MKISFSWVNPNANATGIRVYRDVNPIVKTALPAVYATLPGSAVSFDDTDVVRGATYYYMLETYSGTDSVFSTSIKMVAERYTGPSSQYFGGGDVDVGFYGLPKATDFITYNALISWAGISTSSNTTLTADNQWWMKFSSKGKTLFIPLSPICRVTWSALYLGGLVYGVDGNGPRDYNTLTPTNQLRTITIQNSKFKVRAMTGLPSRFDLTKPLNGTTGGANSGALGTTAKGGNFYTYDSYCSAYDLSGSEWNDLIIPMTGWGGTSRKQRGFGYIPGVTTLSYDFSPSWLGMANDQIFQEMLPGQSLIGRGKIGNSAGSSSYHPDYTSASNVSSTALYWRPVLELIG